jgi:xanthine/CO dehydrogenase XdhC/CoxF family maturation factor
MHLGLTSLLNFFRAHRSDEALVLGTVIGTEGSTYRKPGAMMLIAGDGTYRGLISGGCLEADLATHANAVFKDGETREVNYDMSHGDDFAWGLGLGCDGAVRLMLQKLEASHDFGFLKVLDAAWSDRKSGLLGLVIASNDPQYPRGLFALDCGSTLTCGDPHLLTTMQRHEGKVFSAGHDMRRRYWHEDQETAGGTIGLICIPVMPPPKLLVCGAGHDAVPVARLAAEMGWDCTIVDHRPAFARAERFPDACQVMLMQADDLCRQISLESIDAAVLMTHHLGHDRTYLSQVTEAAIPYIGLLGPRARRDRLLREIDAMDAVVHGPAGLDIGAEMPESIALAIIAEIHAHLNGRDGGRLAEKAAVAGAA